MYDMCIRLAGLSRSDVAECVTWLRPFAHVLEQQDAVELKSFSSVPTENAHNIQTHTVSLELLVRDADGHRAL